MDCLTSRSSSLCLFYSCQVLELSCRKYIDESDLVQLRKDSETIRARRIGAELK